MTLRHFTAFLQLPVATLALVLIFGVSFAPPIQAGTIVIDDFSGPQDPETFVVGMANPGPLLVKQQASGVLGGERDLLLELLGTAGPVSAAMTVGGGTLGLLTGSPGSMLALQYDGFGPGDADSSSGLFNHEGLCVDLSDGGQNHQFQIDMLSLDAGPGMDAIDLVVEVTSYDGTAVYTGAMGENANPFTYIIDLDDFETAGDFSWGSVTSVGFLFNVGGQMAVDFVLDSLTVTVPEPSSLILALPGSLAAFWLASRRRSPAGRSA